MLMMNGIQGVDYTSYDPKTRLILRTQDQLKVYKTHTSTYMGFGCTVNGVLPMLEGADTPELYAKFSADTAYSASLNAQPIDVPTLRAPKLVTLANTYPDIVNKLHQNEIAFVLGQMDEAAFTRFLNDTYFPIAKDAEDELVRMYQK